VQNRKLVNNQRRIFITPRQLSAFFSGGMDKNAENCNMNAPKTYCDAVLIMKPGEKELHKIYHDTQYGFPIHNDNELFCRLILEINQAGLSWTTILNKQDNFRKAYHEFDIRKVAAYKEKDIARLLNDAGIIRNRLKVHAAVENAKAILQLQTEFGSFKEWLHHHHLQISDRNPAFIVRDFYRAPTAKTVRCTRKS
jgi:DNA-3-methyladenine glycosylase I